MGDGPNTFLRAGVSAARPGTFRRALQMRFAVCAVSVVCVALASARLASAESASPTVSAQAGKVVVPKWGGAGGGTSSMEEIELSFWEYSDKRKYISTGKHLDFRIPAAYFDNTINRTGGPQAYIGIEVDLNTGGPSPGVVGKDSDALHSSKLAIRMSISDFILPPVSREQLAAGHAPEAARSLHVPNAAPYCGFDLFDKSEPWIVANLGGNRRFNSRRDQVPPFNTARVFARPVNGPYDKIVYCETSIGMKYPLCRLQSEFNGWPMKVYFSGEHLCELEDVLQTARNFLASHSTEKTE